MIHSVWCASLLASPFCHICLFFWHINYRHSSIKGRSPSSNPFQTVRPFMLLTGSRCGTLEVMKAIKNWRKPFTYKTKAKQKKTQVLWNKTGFCYLTFAGHIFMSIKNRFCLGYIRVNTKCIFPQLTYLNINIQIVSVLTYATLCTFHMKKKQIIIHCWTFNYCNCIVHAYMA